MIKGRTTKNPSIKDKDYSTENTEIINFKSFTIRLNVDLTTDFLNKLEKLCDKFAIDKSEWQFRYDCEE
jgi:hypothetical protein